MRWLDWLILALLAGITGYIGLRMQGALNYDWRWELIPDYMLRYREDRQAWFANLLLRGSVCHHSYQHLREHPCTDRRHDPRGGAVF